MAFNTRYNNNEKNLTVSTFSSIVFANPDSSVSKSRFSIGYLNRLMRVSIALRNNSNTNTEYATYDTTNQVNIYVSTTKAKILRDLIVRMKEDPSIHNVCIETNSGLLIVSDGSEFNSSNYCISIKYATDDGRTHTVTYETKTAEGAYNFSDNNYSTIPFKDIEIDTFVMTLEEYYKASSYAVAASIAESSQYRREYDNNIVKAIAAKVGADIGSGSAPNRNSGSNRTFLSASSSNNNIVGSEDMPKEYQPSSFDEMMNSL